MKADLGGLKDVVATPILDRAERVSRALDALGVPHVLIGGLAVGVHGYRRNTEDVDFLVGEQAFDATDPLLLYRGEVAGLVAAGHTDLMSVPPKFAFLEAELGVEGPVVSLGALVLLKLGKSDMAEGG